MTTQRLHSVLTLLDIAVGIAAVILFISIGENIHRYGLEEFSQFGTNIIGVHPGKMKTGGAGAVARLPHRMAVTPSMFINAEVYGIGSDMLIVFKKRMLRGTSCLRTRQRMQSGGAGTEAEAGIYSVREMRLGRRSASAAMACWKGSSRLRVCVGKSRTNACRVPDMVRLPDVSCSLMRLANSTRTSLPILAICCGQQPSLA